MIIETIINTVLRKFLLRFLLIGFALFFFNGNLLAATANLAWTASTSPNVGGYNISYGQNSGNYTTNTDVGNATAYTVSGLQEGVTYYFAVNDYDKARTTVSGYSNEISYTVPVAASISAPPASINSNGLVAAYGFEEDSGNTVVDASGNGNHGIINEAIRITSGHSGKALQFDGVNDWVTINDSASLDLSAGMTLEAWVYQTSAFGNTVILKEQDGGMAYGLYSSENTDLPVAYINNGNYIGSRGKNPLALKKWIHLVATYDQQYLRLYANGVEIAKKVETSLIQSSSGALRIGGNSLWGEYFQGYIDEVRIYNRALTVAEININLATAVSVSNPSVPTPVPTTKPTPIPTSVPTPVPTTKPTTNNSGLVAAYGFEEVSGNTVVDASGNGNHGIIKEAVRITTGHSGKALKFDGRNDWVTVNNSESLDLSAGMTLEAWVYQQSSLGNTVILKEQNGGMVYNLYSSEDTDVPVTTFYNGSYALTKGTNPVPLNKWTHLVSTYDGQYLRLYVNGVEVAKKAQSGLIQSSSGVLHMGGNSVWGEYFQGYIDEVRIYNRALSVAEINTNLATAVSASNPSQYVLGDNSLEPLVDYRAQGIAEVFQTVATKSGALTNVQVYLDASSTATQLVAGIYKDNNGHPGALIAQGTLSKPKLGAWNAVPIPVAMVTADKPYWIAILGAKGKIGFLDRIGSGVGTMETSASHTLTKLPTTWTRSKYNANSSMSVYGNGY